MTNYDPVAALKSVITNKYTYGNVNTAVTGTPFDGILQCKTDEEVRNSTIDLTNGLLRVLDAPASFPRRSAVDRDERYSLKCRLEYPSSSYEFLDAIMDEIDRSFNDHNNDPTSTDKFDIIPVDPLWFAKGWIEVLVEINRIGVTLTT